MSRAGIVAGALGLAALVAAPGAARAECDCVAVAAELGGALQAQVARADALYADGDVAAALAAYGKAYASAPEPALLFAQAMAHRRLGHAAEARAMFARYLEAGGSLAHAARARTALAELDGGVVAAVGGGALGAVSAVGGLGAGGAGEVGGGLGVPVDRPKPKRLAKGAAIVLGVVAVAAVGAVAVQGISAGLDEDVDFDAKFGLGMGLSGAVVGGTAIYLYGLTAAAGAAASAPCLSQRALVAPVAYQGGGGVTGLVRF